VVSCGGVYPGGLEQIGQLGLEILVSPAVCGTTSWDILGGLLRLNWGPSSIHILGYPTGLGQIDRAQCVEWDS
jgi:hypothetical protein